jgi:hypothetical protein
MLLLIARTSGWIDVALTASWLITVVVVARRWMGKGVE